MAKQVGPIRLEGTIGNLTFYKTEAGYFVRIKHTPSRRRKRPLPVKPTKGGDHDPKQ
jgi:hypothetical protein